ncbi:hypothetical protein [Nocardia altamirensis]|uniref:hypothetical protein n=1 Tax=Nocardia altamirensis TaxID=472158 RepID=UPI0008401A4D|nr:hypothetical protein [Nocardia altamirensis]
MKSVDAHHEGRRVRTLDTIHGNGFAPSFPGWDAPDCLDHLKPLEAGWLGTIHNVESHGANPWTRYGITFDNGIRANGVHPSEVELLPETES